LISGNFPKLNFSKVKFQKAHLIFLRTFRPRVFSGCGTFLFFKKSKRAFLAGKLFWKVLAENFP